MKAAVITGLVLIVSFTSITLLLGIMLPTNRSMPGSGGRFVDVEGSRIHYRMSGQKGPVMIMLHGFGGSLQEWAPLMNEVTCAKLISPDLIGFGQSDRPADITYDLETQRKYLIAFMDKLNIKKAVLAGSSMGASLALWAASRSPERIAGLAAFAPSAYPGSMRHRWPGNYLYRPNLLNKLARSVVNTGLFKALFPNSLGRQALEVTASYDSRFLEALPAIRQPMLLVWSRGDLRVPFSFSDRYREVLPQARFIEAPQEAGHGAAGHPTPGIVAGLCDIVSQSGLNDRVDNADEQ